MVGGISHTSLETISINDPRFAWVVRKYGEPLAEVQSVKEHLDTNKAILELAHQDRNEFLLHLNDYVQSALELTFDQEIIDISASIGVSRNRLELLLNRLGWLGESRPTLEETGTLMGVTRERARQLEQQLLKKVSNAQIWAPQLTASRNLISNILPLAESSFSDTLIDSGIARMPISMEGYRRALAAFQIKDPFELVELDDQLWLSGNPIEDLEVLQLIRTDAIKLTSRQGITNLEELEDEAQAGEARPFLANVLRGIVSGSRSLKLKDDYWILPSDLETRNTLRNRLRKLLAVINPVSLSYALGQLEREERPERSLDITEQHISAIAGYYPEFTVHEGMLHSIGTFNEADELSNSEFIAVQQIRRDGGVSNFGDIDQAIVSQGGARVTTAVTLRYSPVFIKPERDTYFIAGTEIGSHPVAMDTIGLASDSTPSSADGTHEDKSVLSTLAHTSQIAEADTETNTLIEMIGTKISRDEIIYSGSINQHQVEELQRSGHRWAALVDSQNNKLCGYIRLNRLVNKLNSGISDIHSNDPKLHGTEVPWNSESDQIGIAFDRDFVVFCNRKVGDEIHHHVIFRHQFQRRTRSDSSN